MGGRDKKTTKLNGEVILKSAIRLGNPNTITTAAATKRVARLKNELDLQLELICHSRENLQQEMLTSYAASTGLKQDHLKALQQLTACFNDLTRARIALLKAEREAEDSMTPADEKEAVEEYILSMQPAEQREFLSKLVKRYVRAYPSLTGGQNLWHKQALEWDTQDEPSSTVPTSEA